MRSVRRRRLVSALLAIAVMAAVIAVGVPVVREALRDQPNPVALWRFEHANAGGTVALLWSIEAYNDMASFEGPSGPDAPTRVRLIEPSEALLSPSPMRTLDPAVNVSVCPERRPPKGASWWSGLVPSAMAREMRDQGATSYRVEVLARGEWQRTELIDSGCRGVGRG